MRAGFAGATISRLVRTAAAGRPCPTEPTRMYDRHLGCRLAGLAALLCGWAGACEGKDMERARSRPAVIRRRAGEPLTAVEMSRGDTLKFKIRDFLQIHGKGAQPCPRCKTKLSTVKSGLDLVYFCRKCQN